MVDIRTFKVVDRDFNLDQTMAENETLRQNNKILLATGVVVGICFLGVAVYLINEEMQHRKYQY
jgi:hypothetical protein